MPYQETITVDRDMITAADAWRRANDNWKREDYACHCPVALALKAMGHTKVVVEDEEVFADGKRSDLPFHVKLFNRRFDDWLPVEPISFRVRWKEIEGAKEAEPEYDYAADDMNFDAARERAMR